MWWPPPVAAPPMSLSESPPTTVIGMLLYWMLEPSTMCWVNASWVIELAADTPPESGEWSPNDPPDDEAPEPARSARS